MYHKAARDGLLEALKHVNKRDANKRDEDGMTPVHWAASCGNLECLQILCSKGGDPDKPCYDGSTSVHVAAACGQFHCLVFLTKFGSNIWALDNQYHTPLEEAAARGQLDCVQFLDHIVAEQMLHHRSRAMKQKKDAEKVARKRVKKYERLQRKRDKDYQKRVRKQNAVNGEITAGNNHHGSKENIHVRKASYLEYSKQQQQQSGGTNFGSMRRAQSLDHFAQLAGSSTGGSGSLRSLSTLGTNTQGSLRQTFLAPRRGSASASSSFSGRSRTRSLTSLNSANIMFPPKSHQGYRPGQNRVSSKDKYIVKSIDHQGNSHTSIESMRKFDSMSSYRSRGSSQATSSRYSWGSSHSMDSDLDTDNDDEDADETTNDPRVAPLMTFLASLNLEQFTATMRKESIDMKALSLCTDMDLKSAGIPLGPRRKILEAVERRKKACAEPGPLIDTHI